MSSVDALEQTITTEAPQITETAPASLDTELDAIYDRAFVTNGADRGEGGKFVSTNPDKQEPAAAEGQDADTTSLEGETAGEGQADGSTPVDVPLPANWQGKEELAAVWGAIPAEQRAI